MMTEQGQAARFSEKNLRVASRNSGGVRGMSLDPNDRIIGVEVARPDEDVLVIGRKGTEAHAGCRSTAGTTAAARA
jgi:DNA gyrase subunit A